MSVLKHRNIPDAGEDKYTCNEARNTNSTTYFCYDVQCKLFTGVLKKKYKLKKKSPALLCALSKTENSNDLKKAAFRRGNVSEISTIEYEVREQIPVPCDNYFQCIFISRTSCGGNF